jgi:hypothetical protein
MKRAIQNGIMVLVLAGGLTACGKKDGDTSAPGGSDAATMAPSGMASETATMAPPPPPRVVDCTAAQMQAAEPALTRFGNDLRSRGFLATEPRGVLVKTCQFDNQTGRIMALGEYRFKGQMNNDELSFTVNYDTDAGGGNPAYSNFLPDAKLERIVATKRRVLDLLKTVRKPEDIASMVPSAGVDAGGGAPPAPVQN